MELGEKLRQARLAAGLSQRQLCGDVITRNMLSQIESGAAFVQCLLQGVSGHFCGYLSHFTEADHSSGSQSGKYHLRGGAMGIHRF